MNRFENKVALITGSTQGIGAACALRLAADGADVIINGHSPLDERGEKLMQQIKEMGRRAAYLQADVSKVADVTKLVNDAINTFGQLDILVNNAGVEKNHDFWDVTEEDYDFVMDTN